MITEILVSLVIFIIVRLLINNNKKHTNLPPGPWGLPIVGHLAILGKEKNLFMKLMEWSKCYGPILYLRLGSVPTVILNDAKLIREAFGKEEFSGRPLLKVFVEAGGRKGLTFGDGPDTNQQRRFTIQNLKYFGFGSNSMEDRIQEDISTFLKKLQSRTGKHTKVNNFFRLPVINSFWDLIMGKKFDEKDPKLSQFIGQVDRMTNISTVGAQLAMFMPWFATYFGFLGYNQLIAGFDDVYSYMAEEINIYKETHIPGAQKNFTGVYLNKIGETADPQSGFHHSADNHSKTTGDIFLAALDTTTKTLDWLMIHMARNPEIQKKLQAEIDEVVGDSRVPSLSDRNKMSFTEAVIHEVLRLTPTVPLGVQHRTLQDVEFHGYTILKNTMIISNIYGVQNDPNVWENPTEFIPERFLDHNGKLKKHSDFLPFSFGKRNCIGEAHAKDNLFLIGTSFFQKFTVSCTENVPTLDVKFETTLAPHAFELNINIRSENQLKLN